jgi:hypothetical protein
MIRCVRVKQLWSGSDATSDYDLNCLHIILRPRSARQGLQNNDVHLRNMTLSSKLRHWTFFQCLWYWNISFGNGYIKIRSTSPETAIQVLLKRIKSIHQYWLFYSLPVTELYQGVRNLRKKTSLDNFSVSGFCFTNFNKFIFLKKDNMDERNIVSTTYKA